MVSPHYIVHKIQKKLQILSKESDDSEKLLTQECALFFDILFEQVPCVC
jgi:competence protein ComGF